MQIRTVRKEDYSAISDLILTAFSKSSNGYGGEAELVEKIRLDPTYHKTLEVVADQSGQIIGHGLLSEVQVKKRKPIENRFVLGTVRSLAIFSKARYWASHTRRIRATG